MVTGWGIRIWIKEFFWRILHHCEMMVKYSGQLEMGDALPEVCALRVLLLYSTKHDIHYLKALIIVRSKPHRNHSHIHTALPHQSSFQTAPGTAIRLFGFSVLSKVSSTRRLEELGIWPPTFRWVNVPLYLLGHNIPQEEEAAEEASMGKAQTLDLYLCKLRQGESLPALPQTELSQVCRFTKKVRGCCVSVKLLTVLISVS